MAVVTVALLGHVTASMAGDGCKRAGCSGELCVDEGSPPRASICIWMPEFECYSKFGVCERLENGTCGWSASVELESCIQDKKSGKSGEGAGQRPQ